MTGPLKNQRHEKFCQEYIKSGKPGDAYIAAGYHANRRAAQANAIRLLTNDSVLARIDNLQKKTEKSFIATEIADRTVRVLALRDRWRRLQQVIDERAAAAEMAVAPGGKTGLLCRTIKMIGSGPNAYEVEEFEVDTGTLKEIRAHEEQAAKELGQWVEKSQTEVRGPLADVLTKRFSRVKKAHGGTGTSEE